MAAKKKSATAETTDPVVDAANRAEEMDQAQRDAEIRAAEEATAKAEEQGKLPESMAVVNPAPATEMDAASGAFIEPEIKRAIPVDHPSIENNPREGTSAIQNGGDFNDNRGRHPADPNFAGQGIDRSVYGAGIES